MDEVTLERLLSKIRILDNGCWQWTGTISDDGYGVFSMNRANHLAHRLIYQHFVGRIPTGLTLDHLCHTNDPLCEGGTTCPHRRCVCWVGHLEAVTPEENNRRMRNRRTHCVNGHKFTPDTIYIDPDGYRECAICRWDRSQEWLRLHHPGVRHGTETHCPKGHRYEGDNIKITVTGGRACRECQRQWNRRYQRARRALKRGYLPLPVDWKVCPVGHDLTIEDNFFVHQGLMVCLVCMAPDGSRSKKGTEALIAAANGALNAMGVLF